MNKLDTPFLVRLSTEQHAALTEAARAEGASMGDVLRDALDAWLRIIGPVTFDVFSEPDDPADYEPEAA